MYEEKKTTDELISFLTVLGGVKISLSVTVSGTIGSRFHCGKLRSTVAVSEWCSEQAVARGAEARAHPQGSGGQALCSASLSCAVFV